MTDAPPPPQYQTAPETSGKATAALVVAVIGFFVCAPVGGIAALVLAAGAARDIRESNGRLGGEGLVSAARVIGWVCIALPIAAIAAIIVITLLGAGEGM